MPAGDLIADAQLAATSATDFGGAAIALMNRGGARSPGFTFASSPAGEGDGNVSAPCAARTARDGGRIPPRPSGSLPD